MGKGHGQLHGHLHGQLIMHLQLLIYMKPFTRNEVSSQQKEKLTKIKTKFDNFLKPSGCQKMAIIYCLGHQKGMAPVARGNNLAAKAAKELALQGTAISV